ncbi:MAG: chorismate-binding protein [Armatimonadetes bacterium]|nr:chorismate-binding protein [Armatimonadota bacterium]
MRYNGVEVEAWVYDRKERSWLFFGEDCRILSTFELAQVPQIIEQIEGESLAGNYSAGFVCYEASPVFDPSLKVSGAGFLPLAWFVVGQPRFSQSGPEFPVMTVKPLITEWDYCQKVASIKSLIAEGDTYQVNFTFPLCGEVCDLQLTRQAPTHGYLAAFCTESFSIFSASPELFFSKVGDMLTCRPMKGTRPRGIDREHDLMLQAELASSAKDRAENLMIVDMIRNDLGRIAETGSVETPALFEIEAYPTVLQMTSTVTAKSDATLPQIFSALFPCSSITGAPKARTMEIITKLEDRPRGVYTGAIGFVAPGGRAQFSVGIRTAVINQNSPELEYSVGSGIVWDSEPQSEWAECLTKSLSMQSTPKQFSLLESLRWDAETRYRWRAQHIERLQYSAELLEYRGSFDMDQVLDSASKYCADMGWRVAKVRTELSLAGTWAWSAEEIDPSPAVFGPGASGSALRVQFSERSTQLVGRMAFLKSTERSEFNLAFDERGDSDETILWNDFGEVTEACNWNIAAKLDGIWCTPSLDCGLLPGIERAQLLKAGLLFERKITKSEFEAAEEIALFNSVRGWRRGQFC